MITEYLAELIAELRLPRQQRRRIVAEVEDHLTCAAAELHASGLDPDAAERQAVRRFGPASDLARAFVAQEAATAGRRVARVSGVFGVLFAALILGPGGRPFEAQPFPHGLVDFVLAQVTLIAGALTLLRGWRAAAEGGPRGARLALVLRGSTAVSACAAVTVVYEAAWGIGIRGAGAQAWLTVALLAAAVLVTSTMVARAWPLAAAAGASAAAPGPDDDALADLEAVAHRLIGPVEATRMLRPTAAWLREHPRRFAITVAVLAGTALAAAHGISEGLSVRHLRGALVAGTLIASIEAAAALVSFALLGRILAIRPRR